MKRRFVLTPSLAEIEQRLFHISSGLLEAVEDGRIAGSIANSVTESSVWANRIDFPADVLAEARVELAQQMPAHLREAIHQRVAAQQARYDPKPAPGQIVRVDRIVTPKNGQLGWVMMVPLYVFLDAPAEAASLWHGWLVTGESDYAAWWDFVLQEEDKPFDPEAAMVQLWNPVRIYLPMASVVVAQLRPERLQAVRALAADFFSAQPPAGIEVWPGRVAARTTTAHLPVATGGPIGDERDPRHRYQTLYFEAAEAIRAPARLALEALEELPAGSVGSFLRHLVESAGRLGQRLSPEPQVAVAMRGHDPATQDQSVDKMPVVFYQSREWPSKIPDLSWEGIARIRVIEITPKGAGRIAIVAEGALEVKAEIRRAGIVEDRVTATPNRPLVELSWDAHTIVNLFLEVADGRSIELPLST